MKNGLAGLAMWTALGALCAPAVHAQTVLILDDTPDASEPLAAAESLGIDAVEVVNVAGFLREFEGGEWDLVVMDVARLSFTTQLIDLVDGYLAADGSVVVSYFNMDASAPLAELLDIACTTNNVVDDVVSTPTDGIDLFAIAESIASPLAATSRRTDNGDVCESLGDSLVLARFGDDTGEPAVVTSREGLVVYGALSSDNFRGGDADEDGTDDGVEYMTNLIAAALDLKSPELLVVTSDGSPSEGALAYATATETEILQPLTLEELDTLIADDDYLAAVFDIADPASLDPAYQSRIDALRAGGTPVLFFSPAIGDSAAWSTYLGVTTSERSVFDDVVPFGAGLGRALFDQPSDIGALSHDGSAGDAVAVVAPGAGMVALAAYDTGGGSVAVSGDPSGGLVVAGFDPATYGDEDADGDLVADGVEFFGNMIDFGRTAAPVVALLTDASGESPSATAARELGLYVLLHADAAELADTLAASSPAAVVLEQNSADAAPFTSGALDAALAARAAAGDPILVSGGALPAGVLGAIGAEAGDANDSATAVARNATNLARVFSLPESVPGTLAYRADASSFGTEVLVGPGALGSTLATFGVDGPSASLLLGNSTIVVNGFAPASVGTADVDVDRTVDGVELLINQMVALTAPQSLLLLDDYASTEPSLVAAAAARVGLRVELVADATEFTAAFDLDGYQQIAIDASSTDVFASTELVALLQSWIDESKGLTVSYVNFDSSTEASEFFGVVPTDLTSLRSVVEGADDTTGTFREPDFVPSPIASTSTPFADFGDSLALAAGGDSAARFGFSTGPNATVVVFGGTTMVNGFAPRALANDDLDGDGVEDRIELLSNQIVRTGRVPVPLVDIPATMNEGTSITLDASGSFDPFGESLEFGWDLDLDGDFDDGSLPTVVVSAGSFDGDGSTTFREGALRVRNESGLRAVVPFSILVENVAPTINAGTDRTVNQGDTATFNVSINDVPGETFLVTWDVGDGTPAIVGETITHDYAEVGMYTVTVTVVDDDGGEATDTFDVTYADVAPRITLSTATSVTEGSTVMYAATATDPGDDEFTLAWTFGDGGEGASGREVEHTFADNGSFTVTVTATQTGNPDVFRTATLTQVVTNVTPIITSVPAEEALDGAEYVYDVVVADPGADTFTYTLDEAPVGMTIDEDGHLSWTPGEGGYEPVNVALTVADDDGASAEQMWTIAIIFDDADSGGAPDSCELLYGFDIDDPADDESDPDEDGLTVAEECISGRNPTVFSGPGAPTLVSPIDRAPWTLPVIELITENVADPDDDPVTYDFQIFSDGDLSELVVEVLGVEERITDNQTIADVEETLEEDAVYFWRARGVATDVTGPWSEPGEFIYNLTNATPGRPDPIAPIGVTDSLTPTLRIANATDPEGEALSYEFQLYLGANTLDEFRVWSVEEVPEGEAGETSVIVDVELTEGELYTWRARGTDQSRPRRTGPFAVASFVVDTTNTAPSAPELTAPLEGDLVRATNSVTLIWNASDDADGDALTYFGDLALDADFETILSTFQSVRANPDGEARVLVAENLTTGTTYHWRVAATDGRLLSDYALGEFTTAAANTPPGAPSPVSPLAGARVNVSDGTVELIVDNAVDPDPDLITYNFQVADDVDMRSLRFLDGDIREGDDGTTSVFVDVSELGAGDYFWRSRAFDGLAFGSWSSVNGFRVVDSTQPQEDTGVTPDAGFDAGSDAGESDAGSGGGGGGDKGCSAAGPAGGLPALLGLLAIVVTRRRRRR